MAKLKRKSLVGWIDIEAQPIMKFSGRHKLAELEISSICKTKDGLYFHGHATERSKYLYSPRKIRITIEQIK